MRCPWREYKTITKDGIGYTNIATAWEQCYKEECPFFRDFTIKVTNSEYCIRAKNYDPAEYL